MGAMNQLMLGNGDSYKVERPELPAYGAVLVVRPPWFRVGP
jgi:hypothetical protein